MLDESSLGDDGTREIELAAPSESGLLGICKDSPLMWKDGRLGVMGSMAAAESSFEPRRLDSRIAGDGDKEGFGGSSESDRDLFALGVRLPCSFSNCLVRFDLPSVGLAPLGLSVAIVVIDIIRSQPAPQPDHLISLRSFVCIFVSRQHVCRTRSAFTRTLKQHDTLRWVTSGSGVCASCIQWGSTSSCCSIYLCIVETGHGFSSTSR